LKLDNPYHKPLEDFFADKSISKEMKEYLSQYHVDKIDFLIFSQTDYFKKKLLAKIMDNLQTLNLAYKQKNETGKQKYIKRIEDLHKKLQDILRIATKSGMSSFDKIIDSKSYNLHRNNTTTTKSDDSEDSSLFGATVLVLGGCILCIMIIIFIRKVRTND
jgi:hypothetical protein